MILNKYCLKELSEKIVLKLFVLTHTRPIGIPPHAPVAKKNADQR